MTSLDRLIAQFVVAAWDAAWARVSYVSDLELSKLWALYYWSLGDDANSDRHRRTYEER